MQALSNLYHVDGANRQPSVSFADSSLQREPYRSPYGLERTEYDIDDAYRGRHDASPTTGCDVRSCRRGRVSRPLHHRHDANSVVQGTTCQHNTNLVMPARAIRESPLQMFFDRRPACRPHAPRNETGTARRPFPTNNVDGANRQPSGALRQLPSKGAFRCPR